MGILFSHPIMSPLIYAIPAFLAGVVLLYKGSDVLVEGTAHTAAHFGVSSLIISVVVVAFGTSAPEFAISVGAAFQEHADISVGNILGSCVANLILVLGVSAIINPIKVQRGVIKREMPILIAATVILFFFSVVGLLDEYHLFGGFLFLVLFILFVLYFIRCAKKERNNQQRYENDSPQKNIFLIIGGIIGVVIGAWLLIDSAITIAHVFHISPFVISLSMVAVGTSLPELVVSAMASYKNESDIAVGNVLGSNVFNILLILGVAALLIPLGIGESLDHLLILVFVTLFIFPVLYTGYTITRWEGVVLLGIYGLFIWYIFLGYQFIT